MDTLLRRRPVRRADARHLSGAVARRRDHARAGHRPQHHRLLRRQRRPVQGAAVPGADRIVSIVAATPSQRQPLQPISVQDLAVFQEGQTSFEKIGAFGLAPLNLSNADGRPDRFSGGQLTVAAFDARGRPADPRPRVSRGRRSARRRSRDPARPAALARTLRRRSGRRRARPSASTASTRTDHRRDAGDVRVSDPRGRVDSARRSIRWPSPEARIRKVLVIARLKPGVGVAHAKAEIAADRVAARRTISRRRTAASAPT